MVNKKEEQEQQQPWWYWPAYPFLAMWALWKLLTTNKQ
jgi:hypothetical protein